MLAPTLGLQVPNLQPQDASCWHQPALLQVPNLQPQGWGQHEASWGCRLATYSIYSQQCGLQTAGVMLANMRHLGAVGWQPTAFTASNAGYKQQHQHGANMRHLGAVGWQPTAFTASNAGYKQPQDVGPTRSILGL